MCPVDVEKKKWLRQCEGGGFCTSVSDSVFPLTQFCFFLSFSLRGTQEFRGLSRSPERRNQKRSRDAHARSVVRSLVPIQAPSLSHSAFSFVVPSHVCFRLSETTGCFSRSQWPFKSFHCLVSERETRRESQAELVFALTRLCTNL